MPRYKLTIEYDGRPFVGWQIQDNGPSVQGVLAAAIKAFCGEEVAVQGAGRTDAGVHALGQVGHIDLSKRSAIKRHYLYRIINRRADLTFERGRAWRVAKPLNSSAMHAAAQRLVGQHDFTSFRHAECQAKSPVKTLDALDVHRLKDDIHIAASARSFLHTQVRSMVGSLVLVGEGKWSADDLARVLAARDRTACGPVAPPDGLYLTQVDYEEDDGSRLERKLW